MKKFASRLLALSTVLSSAVGIGGASNAFAATNAAGVAFQPANAADAACLTTFTLSYSALKNVCSAPKLVILSLPVAAVGYHKTAVNLFGNNSWCQSLSVNGVGNAANLGAQAWTTAGPQAWNRLDTGSRYVWDETPLVFRCMLEPNGLIGSATAS